MIDRRKSPRRELPDPTCFSQSGHVYRHKEGEEERDREMKNTSSRQAQALLPKKKKRVTRETAGQRSFSGLESKGGCVLGGERKSVRDPANVESPDLSLLCLKRIYTHAYDNVYMFLHPSIPLFLYMYIDGWIDLQTEKSVYVLMLTERKRES